MSKFIKPDLKSALKPTLAVLVAIFLVWAVIRAFSSPAPKMNYLTEKARRGDIVKTVTTTGEVAAGQLVSVGAQVSGQIKTLKVALGQKVQKGDLIAEIDSITQENDLHTNQARLSTYESQLLARQVALKTAQTQYDREVKLKKRDATSDENLENAENALAAAKANVDETLSLVNQARISVNTAETNLGYTKIIAPLDGIVVSIPVVEGQTVNANQTTPTIAQIADLTTMEIKMQISEGDVTKVQPGLKVRYTILSEPERVFEGLLESVDPALTTLSDGAYGGSTDAVTAVYYYGKLKVPNPDGSLRIGMTTQNVITVGEALNVITVPSIAVNNAGSEALVQVLEGGRAVERAIKTGLSDNMNTQVREGLVEGEEVVAAQMTATELEESAKVPMRRGGPPRI
jgi:macrolide-specific efflux system membrane fusion protein